MSEPYDVHAVAVDIAAEMGNGWSAEQGVWRSVSDDRHDTADAALVGPDGIRLHVMTGGYQRGDRLVVDGWLPQGWHDHSPSKYSDGPHEPGEITMSRAKTPRQMARDILRRLVPGWTAYYVATRDRKAAHDARDADVASFGDRLVEITGGQWQWSRRDCGRHGSDVSPAEHPARTDFRVGDYGDTVRAEVHLTGTGEGTVTLDVRDADALVAVARLVAQLRTGGAS